jgi:Kef-type K+ transport system membrane component KefB
MASPGEHGEALRHELEGIGFGLFVSIFLTTGLRYDLQALTSSGLASLQLPMFLGDRGLPALFERGELDLRSRIALGLLSATQLPLVVSIAGIGAKSGRLKEETAASLIYSGMASVLPFPIAVLTQRRMAVLRHRAMGSCCAR